MSAGKYVILLICALGLLSAGAAVTYHRGRASRPLTFWGREAALLIANAPRVHALRLSPLPDEESGDSGEVLRFHGRAYRIIERKDASQARGVSNIRRGLIADESFAWDEQSSNRELDWQHALEFQQDGDIASVLFDFASKRAALQSTNQSVSIRPSNRDFQAFLEEQFFRTADDARVVAPPTKTVPKAESESRP